jgi:hypothetical protein
MVFFKNGFKTGFAFAVTALIACAARPPLVLDGDDAWQRRPKDQLKNGTSASLLPSDGEELMELRGPSLGPFRAFSETAGFLGVVLQEEPSSLLVQTLASDGTRTGTALRTELGTKTSLLIVRALGENLFLVATKQAAHGTSDDVVVARVYENGKLLQEVEVAHAEEGTIQWIEFAKTTRGGVLLWSEPHGENAAIFGAALKLGESRQLVWESALPLVSVAKAWQVHAKSDGSGLALAWVAPPTGTIARTGVYYQAFTSSLDSQRSLAVSKNESATEDSIDFTEHEGSVYFTWNSRKDGAAVPGWNRLSKEGVVSDFETFSKSGRDPSLNVSLHGLVSTKQGPVALLKNNALFSLNALGIRQRAELGESQMTPEVVLASGSLVVLSKTCKASECSTKLSEFGEALAERRSLSMKDDAATTLSWNLQCGAAGCSYLNAGTTLPSQVRSLRFRDKPAAEPQKTAKTTKTVSLSPGASSLARLGSVEVLHNASLPAEVREIRGTHPRESTTPGSARIAFALENGAVNVAQGDLRSIVLVSAKAQSAAGISIASAPKEEDGFAVGWTGIDRNDEEIHIAKFDGLMKKRNEVQLTTSPGSARSISITTLAQGWLVLWVDGRTKTQRVFATRIDTDLRRITKEEIIGPTGASGTESPQLAVLKSSNSEGFVWASWFEQAVNAEAESFIVIARVSTHNASLLGTPARLALGPGSLPQGAPHLSMEDGKLNVLWAEQTRGDVTKTRILSRGLSESTTGTPMASAPKILAESFLRIQVAHGQPLAQSTTLLALTGEGARQSLGVLRNETKLFTLEKTPELEAALPLALGSFVYFASAEAGRHTLCASRILLDVATAP